jgi:hypothetical protein
MSGGGWNASKAIWWRILLKSLSLFIAKGTLPVRSPVCQCPVSVTLSKPSPSGKPTDPLFRHIH